MYEVLEINKTTSNKFEVRVVITQDESAFFTFNTEPNQDQIDTEAEIYVLSKRIQELRQKTEG